MEHLHDFAKDRNASQDTKDTHCICLSSNSTLIAAAMQVLQKVTDVTVEHLYEFATDRNASHVARRLLCVLAGFDVVPPQHNSASMDASAIKSNKVIDRPCACP